MKILNKIKSFTSGKIVLISLALYYGFFFLFYIPFSPINNLVMGNIQMEQVLDLKEKGYDIDTVQTSFKTFGEIGRKIYVRNLWTLDLLFPILSAISSTLLILFCVKRIGLKNNIFTILSFFPFAVMACDHLENILLTISVIQFPHLNEKLIGVASLLTQVKWMGISITSVLSITFVFIWLIKKGIRKFIDK